jgi:hypothetical protein
MSLFVEASFAEPCWVRRSCQISPVRRVLYRVRGPDVSNSRHLTDMCNTAKIHTRHVSMGSYQPIFSLYVSLTAVNMHKNERKP